MSSWQSALEAARHGERGDPTSRYAQLATVDAEGKPHCRTVVVRRLDDEGGIHFVTDARSAKIAHLDHQPWAELCWYFRDARMQFRLAGPVSPLDAVSALDAEATAELWNAMSGAGRGSFAWPPPGEPLGEARAFEVTAPAAPPDTFIALCLEVHEVDHLELRPSPHRRHRHRLLDDGWLSEPINP